MRAGASLSVLFGLKLVVARSFHRTVSYCQCPVIGHG